MYCTKCGVPARPHARHCHKCGAPLEPGASFAGAGRAPTGFSGGAPGCAESGRSGGAGADIAASGKVPSYMLLSAVAFMLFFPTGIFAVYYSAKCMSRRACGDFDGSRRMSSKALSFGVASAVLAVAVHAAYGAFLKTLI